MNHCLRSPQSVLKVFLKNRILHSLAQDFVWPSDQEQCVRACQELTPVAGWRCSRVVRLSFRTRMNVLVAILLLFKPAMGAEMGPVVSSEKKLIALASNNHAVSPAYLRTHVHEMEKQLPLDGLVICVYHDRWAAEAGPKKRAEGSSLKTGQEVMFFGGRRFTRNDFRQDVNDLKATAFRKFSDNFILLTTTERGAYWTERVEHGNLDWFDADWSRIAENGAVAAWVAREAGFKGIFIDAEHYAQSVGAWGRPFDYRARPDVDKRTLNTVSKQVRIRGREWMQAVTRVYPEITIILYPNSGWKNTLDYELLAPFVDGLLEGLGPQATLVDAGTGYDLQTYQQFLKMRRQAEQKGLKRTRVTGLYHKMQYGIGLWLDYESRFDGPFAGWQTDPENYKKNFRPPAELGNTLHNALTVTDRYVWLFVWHGESWWAPGTSQKKHCPLCPHDKGLLPGAYRGAITNCRMPHPLDWMPAWQEKVLTPAELVRMGKGKNILSNESLEIWTQPDAPPQGWRLGGQGPVVARHSDRLKHGKYSVRLSTLLRRGHVVLDQPLPAENYVGKTLVLGAWIYSDKELGHVQILDFVGDDHKVSSACVEYSGKGDGWRFLTTTKTIRDDADRIVFRLGVQSVKGQAAYFDGAMAVMIDGQAGVDPQEDRK